MKNLVQIVRSAAVLLLLGISISIGQVSVSLPATGGQEGTSIDIPLTVGTITGLGVTAFQFVFTFDTSIVRVTGVEGFGTLSSGFTTVPNLTYPGQLRVASAGITPIVGSGTLLIIKAKLNNAGTSGLNFTDFRFNEGSPLATTANGKVTVQKTNQKPVYVSRTPAFAFITANKPFMFTVSAYDPEGQALLYTWKLDLATVQSGSDSTYTLFYTDAKNRPNKLTCVFSDPAGLKDSTTWNFPLDDVGDDDLSIPSGFSLSQNYPNPFNPSTTIQFLLPATASVTLEIFDLVGIRVRTLVGGQRMNPGRHSEVWNGLDEDGLPVPSGTYVYRLRTGDRAFSRTMTLLK
jgi:hypothetical protein